MKKGRKMGVKVFAKRFIACALALNMFLSSGAISAMATDDIQGLGVEALQTEETGGDVLATPEDATDELTEVATEDDGEKSSESGVETDQEGSDKNPEDEVQGETSDELAESTEEVVDGGSELNETDVLAEASLQEASASFFENGYVGVPVDTSIYSDKNLTYEVGQISSESVLFASEFFQEENVYKVYFDTTDDESFEGYVSGDECTILDEDETKEYVSSLNDCRVYNGFFIPVVSFAVRSEGSTDGLWVYDVVDGYARILGYLDYKETDLSVPDMLGGYYVNAIGDSAFAKNKKLKNIYIHGNVISIADNVFASKKVTLAGYNGTESLRYASENEMPFENRTDLGGSVFQSHVVDFSYSDESRFEFLSEDSIRMNLAEAANLGEGSIFYLPIVYDQIKQNYKVTNISYKDGYAVISVSVAELDETFETIEIDEGLVADWSNAEFAEGVEVIEEKFEFGDSANKKVVLKKEYSVKEWPAKHGGNKAELKISVSGEIGLTGGFKMKAGLLPPKLESMDIYVDVDGQVGGKISIEGGSDDIVKEQFLEKVEEAKKDKNALKDVNKTSEKVKYDIPIAEVPLIGINGNTGVKCGIYFRVAITGEVEVVSKVHGSLLKVTYSNGQWSRNHSIQWDPAKVSAAVDIDMGIAAVCKTTIFGSKLGDFDAFAGLNLNAEMNMDLLWSLAAEYTTAEGSGGSTAVYQNFMKCADIKFGVKIEVSFSTDLDWFDKIISKSGWEKSKQTKKKWIIVSLEWPFIEWHFEAPGLDFIHWKKVDNCTNSFVKVNFFTNTGEKLDTLKIQNNTALGIKNEPTTVADPDRRFVLKNVVGEIEGWYYYEGCAGPSEYKASEGKTGTKKKWDFANDKVKGDMTLYAEWTSANSIPVVYNANFESTDPARPTPPDKEEQAVEGTYLTSPGQVKRKDYRFKGWFRDKNQTVEWDFDKDVVTQDKLTNGKLLLYAGWESEPGYDPDSVDTDKHGHVTFNGHSYTHVATYKSYAEAEADAKSQGGYLCTINSKEEQDFLAKYMYQDCAQTYLWLGMTSNDGWAHWKTGETVSYTNWASNPTSSATQYNAAIVRSTGQWTTLSNTETAHYVIEWGTPNSDPNYFKLSNDDFTYTDNGDGTASVTGLQNNSFVMKSELNIPSYSPNNLRVTKIAPSAFKGNNRIEKITLPNTLTFIGKGAFENCTKLKSIMIPNTVTTMESDVFKGCQALEEVTWSTSLSAIPSGTFYGCEKLTSVKDITAVKQIGDEAFRNTTALKSFSFPPQVATIGNSAFYNSGLTKIILPATVTSAGQYAFYSCRNAVKISLPNTLTQVSYAMFQYCTSVSDIHLPSTIAQGNIANSAFSNVNGTYHVYKDSGADAWCRANGKKIHYLGGDQPVDYYTGIDGVYDPTAKGGSDTDEIYVQTGSRLTEPQVEREGMVVEGWYLEPDYITKWDFAKNKVPDHELTLFAKWISDPALFTYDVVSKTVSIRGFTGTSSQVIIPDTINGYPVTKIQANAFVGDSISEIVIPASVKEIAAGAFDCENLEKISLLSDTYFSVHDDGVLYNKKGTYLIYAPQALVYDEFTVPDTVTRIYAYAFRRHDELDKVIIPDTVTSIGTDAFQGNHTVKLFGSVDTCAAKTYASKNNLPYNLYKVTYMNGDIVLLDGVQQAGEKINNYFEPMDDFFSYGGWYKDAAGTEEWNFDSDIMPRADLALYLKWDSLFDIVVTGNTANITGYRGDATKIIVPNEISGKTIVGIDSGAFLNSKVKTIQIPDCVTTIEDSAVPSTVTIICSPNSAAREFAKEYGIKYKDLTYTIHFEVQGGSEVNDIALAPGKKKTLPIPVRSNYYFDGWYTDTSYQDSVKWTDDTVMPENDVTLYACWRTATTNVTNDFAYRLLDDGTAEIMQYSGTKKVLSVPATLNGYTVTRIGVSAFEGNTTVAQITLPKTVTSIGQNAFANSVVQKVKGADDLTVIEEGAFRGASAFSNITLSANLTTIADYAFERCTGLTGITIPDSTTEIGYRAFYGCEFLDTVTLSTSLTKLGRDAFANCPRLKAVSVPASLTAIAADAFEDDVAITYVLSTAISLIEVNANGKEVSLKWNKVKGAKTYAVETKRNTSRSYTRNDAITATTATITLGALNATYSVRVVALDANNNELCTSSAVSVFTSKLAKPIIKSITQNGASSAEMILEAVDGAEGYEVERAYSEDDAFTQLKTVTTTSFTNTGLIKGFNYFYRVRAFKTESNGKKIYSDYSDVFHFQMLFKYLEAPTNVVARQTDLTTVKLTWDFVEDADSYLVYRSDNGAAFKKIKTLTKDTTNYCTDKNLDQTGTYAYKVVAYYMEEDKRVVGEESNAVSVAMKSVPTPEFTSVKQTDQKVITFNWGTVKGVTGYKIYKKDSAEGTYKAIKTIQDATTYKYSSSLLVPGNTYYFTIRAYVTGSDGKMVYSNDSPEVMLEFSSIVQAAGLKVTQSASDKATLEWDALKGVDGYEIWMSVGNNGNYELAATSSAKNATIKSLNDGATYYFKVRGYKTVDKEKNYGMFSDEVSINILGGTVIQVAEQNGKTTVQLIWKNVDSADGYEILRKTGDEEYTLAKTSKTNSAIIYSLKVGTEYSFKVRPYRMDSKKNKTYGFESAEKKVMVLGATKIKSLERSGSTSITFEWAAATGADGYNIYRSNYINGVFTKIKSLTETNYKASGLTIGEAYFFKVVPYRLVGTSKVEGKASDAAGLRLLDKPVIKSIEQTADGTLTLSWDPVPKATCYRIYRASKTGGSYTLDSTVGNVTSAVSTERSANKWYYYVVEAGIEEDDTTYYSLKSKEVSAYVTNLKAPVLNELVQPTDSSLKVSWKKVNGANGYEVLRSNSQNGTYESVSIQTSNNYVDSDLSESQFYYYKIRPYKTVDGKKAFSYASNVVGARILKGTTFTSFERTADTRVDFEWNAVNYNTGYKIYRSKTKSGTYTEIKYVSSYYKSAYDDTVELGKSYYYKVAPYYSSGVVYNIGPMSEVQTITVSNVPTAAIKTITQTSGTAVKIAIDTAKGVEGYELWRKKDGDTSFALAKSFTSDSTTASNLESGKTYSFKLRAYKTVNGIKKYGPMSTAASITLMAPPVISSVNQLLDDTVEIKWNAMNVSEYQIYRKEGSGSYVKLATTTEPIYIDTKVTDGKTYTYKVRAYRKEGDLNHCSGYSDEVPFKKRKIASGDYPESAHPYSNGMNQYWEYSYEGANNLWITFAAETEFENNYDYIMIYDKDGNYVTNSNGGNLWTGTQLSNVTVKVPGNYFKIHMHTDGSVTRYGFRITAVMYD